MREGEKMRDGRAERLLLKETRVGATVVAAVLSREDAFVP